MPGQEDQEQVRSGVCRYHAEGQVGGKVKPLFSLVLFVLSVLSIGSTACGALRTEPKLLNIAWTGGSNLTALPDRVAMERGFFETEGLKPRYIQLQGTNLMLNALLSNEIDYVKSFRLSPVRQRAACLKGHSRPDEMGGLLIISPPTSPASRI